MKRLLKFVCKTVLPFAVPGFKGLAKLSWGFFVYFGVLLFVI